MSPFLILLLYIAFRAKQFFCDFVLQTDWMALTKGQSGWVAYKALFSHTAFHAAGTLLITLIFVPSLWWLALVDFAVHSLVDRLKGLLTYQNDWKPTQQIFWWSFGLDQEVHNFTHLAYIVYIVLYLGGVHL